MRKKVSTLLDETLYRRAKLESVSQGKQISEIIGEALEKYLDERGHPSGVRDAVSESWGSMRIDRSELEAILNEEEDWLDA